MMQAVAALISVSPALIALAWLGITFLGAVLSYGVEAAWHGLSRAVVHKAMERAPGPLGAQMWLQSPLSMWLALYLARAFLWSSLMALAVLRWVPYLSAITATRGLGLWTAILGAAALLAVGARVLGQSLARRNLPAWGLGGMNVLAPLAYLLGPTARALGRVPHNEAAAPLEGPFWTADTLVHTVRHAHQEHLGERGIDLFAALSEFSDTVIREIMVPRTEVVSLSLGATYADICAQVLEAGHSRMPVYEDTIDHIIGVLHVKDLFAAQLRGDSQPEAFDLTALLRPCFYVPEMMQISLLLQEFQRRKTHLAIVVDEYGGTAGVVSLEDIIEEIVGEIQDEYDVEAKQFRVLSDHKVLADARVNLWDLEQALGVSFPTEGEYETLAGFLMAITGYLPQRGAQIPWQNLRFTIKDGNERRIGMVEIERLTPNKARKS